MGNSTILLLLLLQSFAPRSQRNSTTLSILESNAIIYGQGTAIWTPGQFPTMSSLQFAAIHYDCVGKKP